MQFIDEIEGFVSSQINIIKTCLSMSKLEARLASLSIVPGLISLGMLVVILISTWLSIGGLLGYVLMRALDSVLLALLAVIVFNIISLGIFIKYLLSNLKKMSFEKTRAYLNAEKLRGVIE